MKKILIINSNYYKQISENLLKMAIKELKKHKFSISVIDVSGVFEIPVTISRYAKKYDAFLALGCVIKGETPHFEFICKSTFEGIINFSLNHSKPVGNGIITCLNKKQALKRSSLNVKSLKNNKGIESAKAVISILSNVPKKL